MKDAFYRIVSVVAVLALPALLNVPLGIAFHSSRMQLTPLDHHFSSRLVAPLFAETPTPPPIKVDVHVTSADGKDVPIVSYALLNPHSREIISHSNIAGNDLSFFVTEDRYIVRVEVDGYRIVEQSFSLQSADPINIVLWPTPIPLWQQRIDFDHR